MKNGGVLEIKGILKDNMKHFLGSNIGELEEKPATSGMLDQISIYKRAKDTFRISNSRRHSSKKLYCVLICIEKQLLQDSQREITQKIRSNKTS